MSPTVLVFFFFKLHVADGCCTDICKTYVGDCEDYQDIGHTESGVYHVTPLLARTGYDVYCDMTTDGGRWLVFQRRIDGSLDFYRNWTEYEKGFGDPGHEYWLGLLPLKALLSQGFYELRIDLTDFEGNSAYAKFDRFDIGDFEEDYSLKVRGYEGTAGDSFSRHNKIKFSTKDKDNDVKSTGACAVNYKSAWWFEECHDSNLNGQYLRGTVSPANKAKGVTWMTWRGYDYSLKTSEMKIRRVI